MSAYLLTLLTLFFTAGVASLKNYKPVSDEWIEKTEMIKRDGQKIAHDYTNVVNLVHLINQENEMKHTYIQESLCTAENNILKYIQMSGKESALKRKAHSKDSRVLGIVVKAIIISGSGKKKYIDIFNSEKDGISRSCKTKNTDIQSSEEENLE